MSDYVSYYFQGSASGELLALGSSLLFPLSGRKDIYEWDHGSQTFLESTITYERQLHGSRFMFLSLEEAKCD